MDPDTLTPDREPADEPVVAGAHTRRDPDEPRPAIVVTLIVLIAIAVFVGIWLAAADDDSDGDGADSASSTTAADDDDGEGSADDDGEGSDEDGNDSVESNTVSSRLGGEEDLSVFAGALEAAGLSSLLDGDNPITLFAPADDAIEPEVLAATITADEADGERTIRFHMVEGRFTADELSAVRSLDTMAGEPLRVFPLADGSGVLLNNGIAVRDTIVTDDGIIHVIEGLLVPAGTTSTTTPEESTTTVPEDSDGTDDGDTDVATSTTTTTTTVQTTTTAAPSGSGDLAELSTLDPILFADSSSVIADESTATLDLVVEILEANPDATLEIGGHTDDIGPRDGNVRLSERRAQAVRDYLVTAGIDGDRLTAVGYGPDEPIESNDTAEGRAANRRIEFTVL